MRILVSVQNYHPAYSFGGNVYKSKALAEGLHNLGHDVTVVTSSVVDRSSHPDFISRIEYLNGVRVKYLGTWIKLKKVSLNPAVFRFAFTEMGEFDIVHIIGLYDFIGPAVALGARKTGIPYSVEPSGMLIPIVRSLRLKRLYHSMFGFSVLNGARRIVVTSNLEWSEAEQFEIPSEKLFLRRNGIDLGGYKSLPECGTFRKRFNIPEEVPLILWLGRVEPKKNLKQLIEALSGLKDLRWTLAIVGPSESKAYLDSLKELSLQFGIEEQIRFIPGLYEDEKLAAFRDSDLFVLVSINENWGNTVQEAIVTGVPVLVTDTCGASEVVEGRAGLVVKRELSSIRDGIEKMLTDTGRYQKFKAELPVIASQLSWDKPVRQMDRLFRSWARN